MLTAVQPWSGNYEITMPVVWATAHVTQFTKVGWNYLLNNTGSGLLPNGGFYATLVDPAGKDFTLTAVKISRDHAPCTRPKLPDFDVAAETVRFKLTRFSGVNDVEKLYVWHSNFEQADATLFKSKGTISVGPDGTFTLDIVPGDFYTVTTLSTGRKGHFPSVPLSTPRFPLPHVENFQVPAHPLKYILY